jgi:hypothetical protein
MVSSSRHLHSDALFYRKVRADQDPNGKNEKNSPWVGLNIGKMELSVKQKPKGVKEGFVYLIKKLGIDQESMVDSQFFQSVSPYLLIKVRTRVRWHSCSRLP